jgi:tetratricopeptide (TPR) repeat protein
MSWNEHHCKSERFVSEAELAKRSHHHFQARQLYRQAAEAEYCALNEIELTRPDTLASTVVRVVSLYSKAGEIQKAERLAGEWLRKGSLPYTAEEQLRELLESIHNLTAEPLPAAFQDERATPQSKISGAWLHPWQSMARFFLPHFFNHTRIRDNVKILFLAANPVNMVTPLRSDIEYREIKQKIQFGTHGEQLKLDEEFAIRTGDLPVILSKHQADIVHFSGHGSQNGELFLEDEAGKRKAVSIQALADLFRLHKGNICLVVLNACYASEQAKALSQIIDFTIGMSAAIDDRAAIIFASHFYLSLAFGCSVKEAFEQAINQLAIEGFDDASVPELHVREGVDASRFRLVQPRVTSFGIWFLVSLAILLTFDILRRFPGSDGGWWDKVTALAQPSFIVTTTVVVALLAVSLLRLVRPLAETTAPFTFFHEPRKNRRAVIFTASVLVMAFGLWMALPAFARYCNEKGIGLQYREPADLSSARDAYQLAVWLKPDYAQARYNLATLYEDLQPDKAIEEYLLAIRYDSRIYPAYNNLARLYLRRGETNDYESALTLLNQASDLAPQDDKTQYSLNKNLGWANYALRHYALAEIYLRRAIRLSKGQGAAAHCLLAYVLKEQGKAEVMDECYDCVSLAPGEADVEAKWLSDAQECLLKGGHR